MGDKDYKLDYRSNVLSFMMVILLLGEKWIFGIKVYPSGIIKWIFVILFISQFITLTVSTLTGIVQGNFNIFKGLKCKEKEFKKHSYLLINFILLSIHFMFLVIIPTILRKIHIIIKF